MYKNEWGFLGLGFCLVFFYYCMVHNHHSCFIFLSPGTNYESSKYEATRSKKVVGVFCLKFY